MIEIRHVAENPQRYKEEMIRRQKDPLKIDLLLELFQKWKNVQQTFESLKREQNEFNSLVVNLSGTEKEEALNSIKTLSQSVKSSEAELREVRSFLDEAILEVPQLTWDGIPIGSSDDDNVVIAELGEKPQYDFDPLPYWELPVYKRCVNHQAGVKVMGSRGFYIKGDLAVFQKALFEIVMDIVLEKGLELMYSPLMLNDKVLTGTGHLPDFNGQQYEVTIDDNTKLYLIGSSEPSIMGYYMDTHVGKLEKPILIACQSSCFRKEAGSYGKDQQGILRVHQFEKIEMVGIIKPAEAEKFFDFFGEIIDEIYDILGLHGRKVEVCSGDIPHKHYRQIDYEAWFSSVNRYRETHSNGNAADFQNRGLGIQYETEDGKKSTPWGLNCTAITFRTGLAILEQFQLQDGRVRLPMVLANRLKKEFLI